MISLEKLKILAPLQKLLKNVGDLGKIIVANGFENLPKVQLIAQSGHSEHNALIQPNLRAKAFVLNVSPQFVSINQTLNDCDFVAAAFTSNRFTL